MNKRPVYLYSDTPSKATNISNIIEHLSKFGIESEYKGDFFEYLRLSTAKQNELNHYLSLTLIDDIEKEKLELCHASQNQNTNNKILYDGYLYISVINKYFLLDSNISDSVIHIIYTDKLLCTFENRRYHARVVLMGHPSFISTSGLVEAPARPREYYFLKAQFLQQGRDLKELDEYFKGQYLEYNDPKTTEILQSYTLQPIMYELTGKPFCENKTCCLFNSHWQKDVLEIQYNGQLCKHHRQLIGNLT